MFSKLENSEPKKEMASLTCYCYSKCKKIQKYSVQVQWTDLDDRIHILNLFSMVLTFRIVVLKQKKWGEIIQKEFFIYNKNVIQIQNVIFKMQQSTTVRYVKHKHL